MFRALVLGFFLASSLGTVSVANSELKVKIVMDPNKPSGKAWDAGGGKPDPYIKVDGKSYRSSRCKNTFNCTIKITETDSSMTIEVWDADMTRIGDDSAGQTVCGLAAGQCKTGQGALVYIVR